MESAADRLPSGNPANSYSTDSTLRDRLAEHPGVGCWRRVCGSGGRSSGNPARIAPCRASEQPINPFRQQTPDHRESRCSLSQPLPFFAYPFLAVTLFARAWVHYRMPPNQDEPTALRAARYPVRQASMTPLTPAVAQKIEALFPPESREAARGMITGRCGADLPLSTHMGPDPSGFDRIRFAEDTPHYQITRGILEASERCWRLLRNETDEE